MLVSSIGNLISEKIIELKVLSKRMQLLLEILDVKVPGVLSTKIIGNKHLYYRRRSKKESNGEYLGKRKEKTIIALEQKYYFNLLKQTADLGVIRLKRIEHLLKNFDEAELVFSKISKEKKHLIVPYNNCMSKQEIEEWKNKYSAKKKVESDFEFVTKDGTKVRSKSELIIAQKLDEYGIPYKYECPMIVNNQLWFPDFLVMNVKTGIQYYWEHFGLMDNPEYCANALSKIEMYAKEGVLQGLNLIVTSESSKHPVNTKYVDILIKRFLV